MLDSDFHHPIINGANVSEIRELCKQKGMVNMLEDGLQKAIAGTTTVEEVLRVVC